MSDDINGQTVANITDPENEKVTASAVHAHSSEIAFSSAEYYARFEEADGNVEQGGGIPSKVRAHSGQYSLQVDSGSEGFTVKLKKSQGADFSRRYRASVWVYLPGNTESQAEMNNVALVYSINGSQKGKVSPVVLKQKSKSWYRLTLDIIPPANTNELTITCRNNAGRAIYFDDIRLHPLEATMTSYVYDPISDEITHVLNADNFYIQYEYDELGNRTTTKQEFYYPVDRIISRNKIHYATTPN